MSSFIDLLVEIFRFFSNLFNRKRDEKSDLWQQIVEKRQALVKALEEGRVSDSGILQKELERLMAQYSRGMRRSVFAKRRDVANAEWLAEGRRHGYLLVALSLLVCSGCTSSGVKDQVVFIHGERINLVKPGDEIVVPELLEPARQWYLVDNVGLQYWLGISTGLGIQASGKELTNGN